MTLERKAQMVFGLLLIALLCSLALATLLLGQASPAAKEPLKPVVLTADEAKVIDLLWGNLQEQQGQVEQARVAYERAILGREQKRIEVVAEFARQLQAKKAGTLDSYDYDFRTRTFTPKSR